MMTPRKSFEEIARLLSCACDVLDRPDAEVGDVVGLVISAHTHAILQAASLKKREAAGSLAAMPCPTETLQ